MEQLLPDSLENMKTQNLEEEKDKKERLQIKRILVPIDGSAYSIRAARYAIEIAKLQKAQVQCIHVIEPLPYSVGIYSFTQEEYSQEITNQAQQWFEEINKIAKEEGINDIKTELIRDVETIVSRIVQYASDKSIDLIVIGTKGRTGFKRLLLGSVANGVTQHAHCPVLLVR